MSPTDTGDGPVIEYKVYYTTSIFNDDLQWTLADTVPSGNMSLSMYEITIRGLQPGFYKLYVTAVREGGAEGPPSLTAEAITLLLSTAHSTETLTDTLSTSGHSTIYTTPELSTSHTRSRSTSPSATETNGRETGSAMVTPAGSKHGTSTLAMKTEMLRETNYITMITDAMPDRRPSVAGKRYYSMTFSRSVGDLFIYAGITFNPRLPKKVVTTPYTLISD